MISEMCVEEVLSNALLEKLKKLYYYVFIAFFITILIAFIFLLQKRCLQDIIILKKRNEKINCLPK